MLRQRLRIGVKQCEQAVVIIAAGRAAPQVRAHERHLGGGVRPG